MKVSVVIPVYNTAQYLEECLYSITNQSYQDIEIICIDDNSQDDSINILEILKDIDCRISIIKLKENLGPGFARNQDVKYATGDYLFFVDSDDYLEANTIQTLLCSSKFGDIDILVFNGLAFGGDISKIHSSKYFPLEESFFENNHIREEYLSYLADFHSPCMKLYKTSFIKKNEIYFPVSIVGEDVEFSIRCLLKVKRIDYVDFIGYNRRYRGGSIMTSNMCKNLKDRVSNFENLLSLCKNNIVLYNYIVGTYIFFTIHKIYALGDKELIEYTQRKYDQLINKYNE